MTHRRPPARRRPRTLGARIRREVNRDMDRAIKRTLRRVRLVLLVAAALVVGWAFGAVRGPAPAAPAPPVATTTTEVGQ